MYEGDRLEMDDTATSMSMPICVDLDDISMQARMYCLWLHSLKAIECRDITESEMPKALRSAMNIAILESFAE